MSTLHTPTGLLKIVVSTVEGPDAAVATIQCLEATVQHWLLHAVRSDLKRDIPILTT
jgi:predicted RNA polymerase sigma factor